MAGVMEGIKIFNFVLGEETHKIPVDDNGLAGENDTYRSVWLELLNFVNPEKKNVFPPVYSRVSKQLRTCFLESYSDIQLPCIVYIGELAGSLISMMTFV